MKRLRTALLVLLASCATAIAAADCPQEPDTAPDPAPGAELQARIKTPYFHSRRSDREARGALAVIGEHVRIINAARLIDQDFTAFDPDYRAHRAQRRERLDALKARLDAEQHKGHWLYCSQALYNDAEWRIEYTALWPAADRALDALEASFSERDQAHTAAQSPDGSFGGCRAEFIFRLDRTVNAFNAMPSGDDMHLAYRLTFLAPIAEVNGTAHLLFSRATSAIAETGVYAREEQSSLNESLPQLVFKPDLRARAQANGATFLTARYRDQYRHLLDAMQDPATGFWGPALLTRSGTRMFLPDLSMTYHIAAYRRGCVARWDQLLKTLLAMERTDYPYGWRWQGRVTPHNAYDVVRLLALGWPHASTAQREAAREAIARMITTTLTHDIAPNGRVRFDPAYSETEAAAYYFAIAFLDAAGYWQGDRFWTSSKTIKPGAGALCRRLKSRVAALAGESPLVPGALARLRRACP